MPPQPSACYLICIEKQEQFSLAKCRLARFHCRFRGLCRARFECLSDRLAAAAFATGFADRVTACALQLGSDFDQGTTAHRTDRSCGQVFSALVPCRVRWCRLRVWLGHRERLTKKAAWLKRKEVGVCRGIAAFYAASYQDNMTLRSTLSRTHRTPGNR